MKTLARRHKALTSALGVLLLVLVSSVAGVTTLYLRAEAARGAEAEQRVKAERQAKIVQGVNQFLNGDLLVAADPKNTANPNITVREALDKAAERIKGRFPDEPLVEAGVCETPGNTYFSPGEYEKAEAQLRRAPTPRTRS